MTTKIINIETINETDQSDKATIITLDSVPSIKDQKDIFAIDESVVLEF